MGRQGGAPGRADYWSPGDWNVQCSMCGRKRKASQVVRNWQGLYRCPEHDEPRQTQDFVHNVRDVMTVPFAQPESRTFLPSQLTIPGQISPPLVIVVVGQVNIANEQFEDLATEGGSDLEIESAALGTAILILPAWVVPVSYEWSWRSGGSGLVINSVGPEAIFEESGTGNSGIAQCTVTDQRGAVGIFTVEVQG